MNGSHESSRCDNQTAISQVYLSGGGFRAALGSAGVIGYLLMGRQDGETKSRWAGVDEVISVSGASLLNGVLAQSAATTDEEFCAELGGFVRRMVSDGARLRKGWRRIAATLLLVGCLVLSSWTILAIFGIVTPLASDPRAAAVLGVLALPLPVAAVRLLLDVCLRDGIRAWMVPRTGPVNVSTRRFVFATVGLETGEARFLAFGESGSDGELQHAVRASASLPGVGWLPAARTMAQEDLGDGGVLGFFGSGYGNDARISDGSSLFVDARSAVPSNSGFARLARRSSLAANLACWLRISLEASYRLEREGIAPGRIVRLTAHAADDLQHQQLDSLFTRQLAELRRRVGRVGLYGFTPDQAALIVAAGVVSCAHELDGLDDSEDAVELLLQVQHRLPFELNLVHAWRSTARGLALYAEPGAIAMSHGGLDDGVTRKHSPEAHHLAARTKSFGAHHVDVVRRSDGALVSGHSLVTVKAQDSNACDLSTLFDGLLEERGVSAPMHLNVEVKRRHTHAGLRELLHELDRSARLDQISVSAPFHTGFLRRLRREFPTLATNESLVEGALLGMPIALRRRSRRNEASGVQLHYWIARSAMLRRAAMMRAGHVEVWGVNTIARAKQMVAVGIDVIITDELVVAEFVSSAESKQPVDVLETSSLVIGSGPAVRA